MPNLPYKSSGWDTHSEVKLREIAFPMPWGDPSHFTIRRTYEGPLANFSEKPLDALDPEFAGNVFFVQANANTDVLTFNSPHPLFTGCPLTVGDVTGMTGVAAADYFAIWISNTAIKLANTIAFAEVGTAVDFSADGNCNITLPTAYLVEMGPLVDTDGGQVRYDRTFATVPASWSDDEEYAFTFPAYTVSQSIGNSFAVTAITANTAALPVQYTLATTATGISAADAVYLSLNYKLNNQNISVAGTTRAVSASSGVNVVIAGTIYGPGTFTNVTGTIRKARATRPAAEDLVVGSRLQHDYALTSQQNVDNYLPIVQRFRAIWTATGETVDTLNTTSEPTAATYASMIDAETEIVAEPSRRRRYLGNIRERITRFVKAR